MRDAARARYLRDDLRRIYRRQNKTSRPDGIYVCARIDLGGIE
jgi:hypothetical protein